MLSSSNNLRYVCHDRYYGSKSTMTFFELSGAYLIDMFVKLNDSHR
jgi:hypothetical protein